MGESGYNRESKYLISTEEDELWGLVVTSVGSQQISAKEAYPPAGHPQGYAFNVDEGRILSEYQLLYITDGEGIFTYGDSRESQLITEGKMFFLFPGVWHTYRPFANSGWKEYWIGFKGSVIDRIVEDLSASILRDFDKEVASSEIGTRVMNQLRSVDQVAYVRFASVYRKFKDVEEFIEEIRALK